MKSLTSSCQMVLDDVVNKVTCEAHVEDTAYSGGVHACTNHPRFYLERARSCKHKCTQHIIKHGLFRQTYLYRIMRTGG